MKSFIARNFPKLFVNKGACGDCVNKKVFLRLCSLKVGTSDIVAILGCMKSLKIDNLSSCDT